MSLLFFLHYVTSSYKRNTFVADMTSHSSKWGQTIQATNAKRDLSLQEVYELDGVM